MKLNDISQHTPGPISTLFDEIPYLYLYEDVLIDSVYSVVV
jgi:hypothetical protein